MPSASLVPASYDPSVLLTTAGMQPFKPYFRGEEKPPHVRLTSCQKVFRTTDIENVGLTARHLTFFEMLGNFSFGDYFKQGAAEFAWELSTQGFGFDPEQHLGHRLRRRRRARPRARRGGDRVLARDRRARTSGSCASAARTTSGSRARPGPCGPCSELYLDRGLAFGREEDRPGDDTERFLEFWNLVFMQYELQAGRLAAAAARAEHRHRAWGSTGWRRSSRTSRRSSRPSTSCRYIRFGEELSGRRYGQDDDPAATRALRILADHGRGDGVPAGRRRRALERGPRLHPAPDHAARDPAGARRSASTSRSSSRSPTSSIEVMGDAYPQLHEERDTIAKWAAAEEEGFRRTLDAGREAARRDRRRARRRTAPHGCRPRTPSSCTTPTASRTS